MSAPTVTPNATEMQLRERILKWILIVSWVDLVLLLPLLYGLATNDDSIKPIFGPLHGTGFLIEVGLIVYGSINKWWGWWYPVVTLVTLGPPGAILGHPRAKREALGA